MPNGTGLAARGWRRWKRIAHRAAEIQSFVVLTLLYWIVVVPIGLARRRGLRRDATAWKSRGPALPVSVSDARRQS